MWLIICIVLMLLILIFNYSASENNESYDSFILQKKYFDKYINSNSLIFVEYIGNDRCEVKHNQSVLIAIDTTDDNKVRVELDDTYILYENFEHFNFDWRFRDDEYY